MPSARHLLDYPFEHAPAQGERCAINPHIEWLRMPLPFSLSHINVWLLEDDGGKAIVDTGINNPDSIEVWQRNLTAATGSQGPTRVVVTHMHPDHVGLAGHLCDHYGVELWITRSEYYTCRVLAADTGKPAPHAGVSFYRAAGFDAEQIERYVKMFGLFGRAVSALPNSFRRLQAGDRLQFAGHEFEVLIGSGHSPEHACLFSPEMNVVFSGDQILPTISSNVSVWPTEPHANPLDEWLASCRRLREQLPADVLVLPAHGKPFRGAHARLTQLIDEHETGLAKLLDLCAQPRRTVDVFPALFKAKIKSSNFMMATGEAVAHLHYLLERGEVSAQTDADGVRWFERS